ncbi:MAG: hypothetical protein HY560_12150 [Gemmatimonadetes bacterium]|nr:hypothetical protein [Gemmatimonadota bacterium]
MGRRGGAYQSTYLVDPAEGLVLVFMSQHLPNVMPNVRTRFVTLVYQALVPGADARPAASAPR